MPQIKTPPTLLKRRSGLHGWGMFTVDPIGKIKRIVEYAGEKITIAESENREARYLAKGTIWCFRINRRWARDGNVQGNMARFINHACKPNCYSMIIGHTVLICAARNIEADEELTYNYYTEGEGEIPCVCRPGCQNLL